MKFYDWKSLDQRDLVLMKSVGTDNPGYIIEAETNKAVSYLNKVMDSVMLEGLSSKWITVDQVAEDALFFDSKKVFLQFMEVLSKTDFIVDDHVGYETYLLVGAK
tara:strand:+ start:261 stop:575 length:315 start_codon:yes stop_codon:yes gene_type:complete